MKAQTAEIKNRFVRGLKEYLLEKDERALAEAYESGRHYLKEGVGELKIISIYHKAIAELREEIHSADDEEEKFQQASIYLTEWLSPYEMRQRGYEELVHRLQENNKRLEEEIERRKETEQELKESKEYFESLIENAQDIITVLNHDGTVRYQSPSIKHILGYEQEELDGEFIFEYFHPEDVGKLKEMFYEGIEEPDYTASVEYRFRHKNGEWRYLESIAKNIKEDAVVIINSRDVTERVEVMQKLEEKRRQLVEAQHIAKVGSWEWQPGKENGLSWSDEMCHIYGIEPEEFDHSYDVFLNHVHPDDLKKVTDTVEEALEKKKSFSFEHRIIRADGEERVLFGRGHILTDEEGEIYKVVGTGQDITERKQVEKQLRNYSEKLRNLSAKLEKAREEERKRIAREIHDELGQMLTVLKMDFSLVIEEIKDSADKSSVEQAKDVMNRVDTIIESVQKITTKLRPEVLDDLGLVDAIKWQGQEYGERSDLDINFKTNIEVQRVPIDEERSTAVFRIFQETLTNVLRHAEATKVNISLNIKDKYLVLRVDDDGKGLSENSIIGKSLGIMGMRERSQFLGGDITIDSEPGEGTTVILKIPLEQNR